MDLHLRHLGERIRGFRAARGMTRRDLSRHAQVSERYLADLERGAANPSAGVLWRIAEAMGVPFDTILAARPTASARPSSLERLLTGLDVEQQREAHELLRKHFAVDTPTRRGVALVGLRGAGKTTLGRRLAQHYGVPFVRLSEQIVRIGGIEVDEVFSVGGQRAYRRLEREALDDTMETHSRAVVEAGGSLVSEDATFARLRDAYFTVWLRAAPEDHMQRVIDQGDLRPMRGNARSMDDLRLILAEREPAYRLADAQLDTSGRGVETSHEELAHLCGDALAPSSE